MRSESLEDVVAKINSSESDKPRPLLESREDIDIEEEEDPTFNGVEEETVQSPPPPPLKGYFGWMDMVGATSWVFSSYRPLP